MTAPTATRMPRWLLRRRPHVVGTALIGLCAGMLIGCSQAESSATDTDAYTTDVVDSPEDQALAQFRDAIMADGVTTPLTDDTLQALGDGICRQLAVGTERATIIENLRSVTHNGATSRPGQLQDVEGTENSSAASSIDADPYRLGTVIVDAAEAEYCRD
ncbi:hypothetical protein ACFRFQ_22335 [Rhodococcus sp. NPDC056743]|uniref:hypothetical protein n=1 Tax=Rhodococcus sp. NPDC056743 TaxID=3345934 RepID=UPI00366E8FC6